MILTLLRIYGTIMFEGIILKGGVFLLLKPSENQIDC